MAQFGWKMTGRTACNIHMMKSYYPQGLYGDGVERNTIPHILRIEKDTSMLD
jgi:hypothetical protein